MKPGGCHQDPQMAPGPAGATNTLLRPMDVSGTHRCLWDSQMPPRTSGCLWDPKTSPRTHGCPWDPQMSPGPAGATNTPLRPMDVPGTHGCPWDPQICPGSTDVPQDPCVYPWDPWMSPGPTDVPRICKHSWDPQIAPGPTDVPWPQGYPQSQQISLGPPREDPQASLPKEGKPRQSSAPCRGWADLLRHVGRPGEGGGQIQRPGEEEEAAEGWEGSADGWPPPPR